MKVAGLKHVSHGSSRKIAALHFRNDLVEVRIKGLPKRGNAPDAMLLQCGQKNTLGRPHALKKPLQRLARRLIFGHCIESELQIIERREKVGG
jgi:hypothetical protein